MFYRIETNGHLTANAEIVDEKRKDRPKELQLTSKKITPSLSPSTQSSQANNQSRLNSSLSGDLISLDTDYIVVSTTNSLNFSGTGWWGRILSAMKVLIPIVIGLLAVGCGKKQPAKPNEGSNVSTKPAKELSLEEKKVVGTYEWKTGKDIIRLIFLKSGIMESSSVLGDKENKWEIRDKEIHAEDKVGNGECYRIEPNGDITKNAVLIDGERSDLTKEEQMTFKKIKSETKETPSKGDDKNSTKAKPSKELTIKDVAGTYEARVKGGTAQMVFLENGKIEFHENGKVNQEEARLKIAGNEIHFDSKSGDVRVFRIEPNGDLTYIAEIEHGKRHDHTKEWQATFKKIK